jgi:hypothetical protein
MHSHKLTLSQVRFKGMFDAYACNDKSGELGIRDLALLKRDPFVVDTQSCIGVHLMHPYTSMDENSIYLRCTLTHAHAHTLMHTCMPGHGSWSPALGPWGPWVQAELPTELPPNHPSIAQMTPPHS